MINQQLSKQDKNMLELLPWYVNGTLEGAERRAVEQFVNSNIIARKEYDRLKGLESSILDTDSAMEAPDKWPELLVRIEASELAERRRWRLWSWWSGLGRLGTAIIAAQAAAIVCLAILVFKPEDPAAVTSLARTLTSKAEIGTKRYRIVFSPDATELEIRQLLLQINAQIVLGPSPKGVYNVVLSSPQQATAVVERAADNVRFFEPVSTSSAAAD